MLVVWHRPPSLRADWLSIGSGPGMALKVNSYFPTSLPEHRDRKVVVFFPALPAGQQEVRARQWPSPVEEWPENVV